MTPKPDDLQQPRVKDAASARQIYSTYLDSNRKRAATYAQTRNQIDGGRPKDPAVMEKNGESWQTNINFRDAESSFNRTFLPYWKMVHDAPNKIAVAIETGSPAGPKWEKAFAECFDKFLNDWGADYFFQFMLFTNDFVKFGPGYVMWADGDSARFKHARTEYVLVPKRAKANIADWEIAAVEGEMSIAEMWLKIHTPGATKRTSYVGWNVKALKQAIAYCMAGDGSQTDAASWTRTQDEIVSNDMGLSETHSPLEIVRLFVKGFDGKIALYVFAKNAAVPDFLFESGDYAEEFKHVIGGLFYDVGTAGLVHSIKGFGIKNYYFSMLQNRMKSRMMDSASIGMGFNFIREDEGPAQSPPVEHYSAVNIFPRGLKQIPIYPQLGNTQSVLQVLSGNVAENNFIYRDSSKDIAETGTARQAVILANLSEEIGSATASIYLSQVGENVFAETFRRLMKAGSRDPDAVKFKKRLTARGVPWKQIDLADVKVTTGANPGTAGAALRDMIFKELLGMMRLPGMNGRAIIEAYLSNRLGTQAIGQFMLPAGQDSAPGERRLAMMENSVFGQGLPLPVDPADSHPEHAEEHLKPLAQMIQVYTQQQKLAPEALVALQTAIPHLAKHFEFMQSDETLAEAYKTLYPAFSQVTSIARGIFTNLMKQRQAQAGGPPNSAPPGPGTMGTPPMMSAPQS